MFIIAIITFVVLYMFLGKEIGIFNFLLVWSLFGIIFSTICIKNEKLGFKIIVGIIYGFTAIAFCM